MVRGLWGKKIGMTQVFSDDHKALPVTVIDVSDWFITNVKTKERDGYAAVQLGCVKKRYKDRAFDAAWLKKPKQFFSVVREVALADDVQVDALSIGQPADISAIVNAGDLIDAFGVTVGKGFQGVVKRHGFSGGRGSHGDKLGRGPGALQGETSCGHVPKGKKMPGHMGVRRRVMRNLKVVKVDADAKIVVIKGSVPGKSGSLLFLRKQGE